MPRERTLLRWRYTVHKDTGSIGSRKGAGVSSAGTLLAVSSDAALEEVRREVTAGHEVVDTMEHQSWFSGGIARVRMSNRLGTSLTIATVLVVVTDPRRDDPMREGGANGQN